MPQERPQAVAQVAIVITVMESESKGRLLNVSIADTFVEKNLSLVQRTGVGIVSEFGPGLCARILEMLNASYPLAGDLWGDTAAFSSRPDPKATV